MELSRPALRRAIALVALALGVLASGCAGAKKEAREPKSQKENVTVQCPYCKAVFHW